MVSDFPMMTNLELRDDSDESMLERGYEENEVNSLKLRNLYDDIYDNFKMDDYKYRMSGKKKKEKRKKRKPEETKRITNRKIVNLPASQPYTRMVDGEERLCFKYNTKVSESALNAMPKTDLEDNEFCVRFDLDSVDISKLNEKFKADNCVYPRANLPFEMYVGNRWEYETECNRLAWAFVSLNPVLLYGKKGLIQRAVDSYRNINKQSRSRRVVKEDKFPGDIEKRKHVTLGPTSVTITWTNKAILKKCKIQVNVDNINYCKIDEDFKAKFSVLEEDYDDKSFGLEKRENRNPDNELAVKIAFLNVDNSSFWNAIKVLDKTTVLRKTIVAYKQKCEELVSSEDDTTASELVSNILGSHYKNNELNSTEENFYFET